MRVDMKGLDLTATVKGKTKIFEFPSMPVEINIEVPIPDKKWDPLLQQKLMGAAKVKFEEIQKLFASEMIKIDAKVAAASAKDPASVNLADEQNTANVMSKQIAATLPTHVQMACQKVYDDMKKANKELLKYNVKCALKIAWAAVKISVAAARLGASHGADVTAYVTVAKEVYAIGLVVYELAKSSDTLEKEVGKEYKTLVDAVAKAKKETKGIMVAARQLADVEPKCKKVEEKLGIFKPKITNVDQKSHALATSVDKLLNAQEKTKGDLNPKALAKADILAQKIDKLLNKIENMQVKVEEQRKYATAVEISIKSFRADYAKGTATTVKVTDFLAKAKEMYDSVKEVVDVVKEIVSLAA